MNTPGFAAHDSLYRSNQHYAIGLISSCSPPATLAPAYKFPQGGGGDCHETCGACGTNCMKTCQNTCLPEPYPKSCCKGTERCTDGVCKSCPPGFTGCGGSCVDLSNDPLNCGACGVTCKTGTCCVGTCGTDCHDGGCCQDGYPCCDTPFGKFCCSHKCNHSPIGNFNYCT